MSTIRETLADEFGAVMRDAIARAVAIAGLGSR